MWHPLPREAFDQILLSTPALQKGGQYNSQESASRGLVRHFAVGSIYLDGNIAQASKESCEIVHK